MNNPQRLKRLRRTQNIRDLLCETYLHTEQLIAPIFISAIHKQKTAIKSMPGVFQFTLDTLAQEIEELSKVNINTVLLFGIPEYKDATGSSSLDDNGIVQRAIRLIRNTNPNMTIIADVCFCEYTDHGHCGIMHNQTLDNDATLEYLGLQAVSYAAAGADWVAPSSMTDGMVTAIRTALNTNKYHDTAILSYAVKYSSCLYGPFRDAAMGAPQYGDRKTYQMNPANTDEALREALVDLDEGADLLMVKPAGYYLDIIYRLKNHMPQIPLCAYQVSGEYSMLKCAAANGLINEQQAIYESLIAIKRAGADLIISYFAKDYAKYHAKYL